jgi:predicted  nucleic acid-binding Zn-ribbon protein
MVAALAIVIGAMMLQFVALKRLARDSRATNHAVALIKDAEYDAAEAKAEANAANETAEGLKKEIRRLEDHLSEIAKVQQQAHGKRGRSF